MSEWLCDEGLEALVDAFRAHNIDGAELISLNTETLTTEFNIGEETHNPVSDNVLHALLVLES